MRLRLAAGLLLASGPAAVAVPPAVPFLPPEFIQLLPEAAPVLTDPAKLADRIEANTKAAADKLAGRDPGADTRTAQQQALRDIDELLKQMQNQPPPPMPMGGDGGPPPPPMGGDSGPPPPGGGQPLPMGGSGQKPPPMGGGKPSPEKKPGDGQPMPTGGQPMPGGEPSTGGQPMGQQPMGGTQPGNGGAKSKPAMPLDDPIAKQVWGHLPDTVRKQMSQYYQEQFMPRYGGLLRDYYTALAEREKPPGRKPDR